uniref:Uncharacterized protein n=1 Tax=Octopus bimaculoides TaxID=37653 RepID=A0A0L8HAE7_OCTBM
MAGGEDEEGEGVEEEKEGRVRREEEEEGEKGEEEGGGGQGFHHFHLSNCQDCFFSMPQGCYDKKWQVRWSESSLRVFKCACVHA